jgi:hypothetical protein
MNVEKIDLFELSDTKLLEQLHELVHRDENTQSDLLRHLAEVDRRQLHLKQACSNLVAYCTQRPHTSEVCRSAWR